jgi:ABC-type multidrug transport system fused ATPase/permease subunit
MPIAKLHKFLTTTVDRTSRSHAIFWLILSLTFAAVYAILGMKQAFSGEYIVQDDARQHVFWMMRFVDAELFPNDFIANYYQSVAPAGYSTLYKLAATIGIPVLLFHKILPFLIALISTYYCFGLCLEMLPVPMTGFIASLLLNQHMWMTDDLASTTARAFIYPIFIGFLYYLLRGWLLPCLGTIALIGLFYPPYALVAAGVLILRLLKWKNGRLCLSDDRTNYLFCSAGLGVAFLVMLPYALDKSEFGPTYTAAEAKKMGVFATDGRNAFFRPNPIDYWLTGRGSGIFPKSLFTPVTHCAGLLLPLLLLFRSTFPLADRIQNKIWLLLELFLASLAMFFAAHATIFKLYQPGRYTAYSLRIIIVLMSAIALTLIIDGVAHWAAKAEPNFSPKNLVALITTAVIAIAVVLYPCLVKKFPTVGYVEGKMPALYKFFQQQPKDILIASIAPETDNLPTFSQRSVLVAKEYAVPYQKGYYNRFQQRVSDLIRAQYTPDRSVLQNFIKTYGIDFWMLDRNALTLQYVEDYGWIDDFDSTPEAIASLKQGKIPVLAPAMTSCAVFQNEILVVLETSCIVKLTGS